MVRQTKINVCPTIDLTGQTWETYLAGLGSEHRYNFRRKLKNLEKRFAVRFELASSEPQCRQALETLVALHSLRWNQRGGSDAFFLPEHIAFHKELSSLALPKGWLRLFTLYLDDKAVASLYGFRYGRVFYFFQSGFDPAFSNYSTGLITMGLAIKSAIEEGAQEYDLLHGAEQYKFHWAREARELGRIELYPPGPMGFVRHQLDGAVQKTKRVVRDVLPQSLIERIILARRSGTRKRIHAACSGQNG